MRHFRRVLRPVPLVLATALGIAGPAWADAGPGGNGVVTLSAGATAEVTKDWMSVSMSATRDGPDAAGVQTQLKQLLDAALAEARRAARPGQVEIRTGSFNVSPRYGNKGAVTGWHGSAELAIEGRDLPAIGQLTGRIPGLAIARVGYDISRELREKSEAELSAQAIASYRARAAEITKQFGYATYEVREVSVTTGESSGLRPMPMMAMRVAAAPGSGDEPLPTEPGKGTVTVSVSGSVQMTR